MAEDLILKASLDTSEAEADAQKLKSSLAKVDGVSTSSNAGKALATNMTSARVASEAMFRSLQAMGGPVGRIAGMMKAFSDSARMLQSIPGGTGGPGGTMQGWQAANVASNLGGGAIAGSSAGAAVDKALKANAEAVTRQLTDRIASNPSLMPETDMDMKVLRAIQNVLPKHDLNLDGTKFSPKPADLAASELTKLASSSVAAQFKLASFAGKLGMAGQVIGTFAAAVAAGIWLQKKLSQTELQRESARKASLDEFHSWMKDRAFSHTMRYGTEEQKRNVVERELGKTDEQLAAVNAWRAAFAKEGEASGIKWTPSEYREAQAKEKAAREEREAALRKMESGGAKLDRNWSGLASPESVEAWWLEQSKKKAGLKDTRLDLDVAKKALSKFTPKTPVTDELTRIGGSIGGGIDYQRSMANSLTSIDRAVAIIRASVTAKSTTYI